MKQHSQAAVGSLSMVQVPNLVEGHSDPTSFRLPKRFPWRFSAERGMRPAGSSAGLGTHLRACA